MAKKTASAGPAEPADALQEKTLKDLQEIARSLSLKGIAGQKKQDLIERIQAAQAGDSAPAAPAAPVAPAPEPAPAGGFSFKIVSKEEVVTSDARRTDGPRKGGRRAKPAEEQPGLFTEAIFADPLPSVPDSPVVTPVDAIELPARTTLRHDKYRRKPRAAGAPDQPSGEPEARTAPAPVLPAPVSAGEATQDEEGQTGRDDQNDGGRRQRQRFRRREKLNPDQIDTEQFKDEPPAVAAPAPVQEQRQDRRPDNRRNGPQPQRPQQNGQGDGQPQDRGQNRQNNAQQRDLRNEPREQREQREQREPREQRQQGGAPQQPQGPRPEPWAQYNLPDSQETDLQKRLAELSPQMGGFFFAEGVLDIQPERFGILRSLNYYYQSGPDDIYVSPALINRFRLRQGDTLVVTCRPPKVGERYFGAIRIEGVNGKVPTGLENRMDFESLLPVYPDKRLRLEYTRTDYVTRIIDLFAPVGRGQRAMIVAQPKTGKTTILRRIANAVHENHPEMKILVLLVDERPEEVTEMERTAPGTEVSASTFDQKPENHVALAELTFEKAKRLVEAGHHVLILLDSITRLARAYNAVAGNNGRTMSGGIDSQALKKPRQLFSAARNIEGGGSLTIIATALVDTGSRMDDVIFEEFKGTGNMEIALDRRLANNRIFPAIDVFKSGTRREDLFVDESEREKVSLLRRYLNVMSTTEAMEFLLDKIKGTRDNQDFLLSMNREGR